ncbi:MAG TPA: alpha-L-arabinofuranosidase C-terminal domain-containing protein [Alphaproteobacteria bacterium]|nr:alpha-L-arabinofuranosidase C-terminal domain-containing protein [Alphaproteobacteria bacterium]
MNKTGTFTAGLASLLLISFLIFPLPASAQAESNPIPVLKIKADQPIGKVSPTLYGLMTEEINYSYEGGLYAELIANRTFNSASNEMKFWSASGGATMSLDSGMPLNDVLTSSMKLDASSAGNNSPASLVNSGYWGIPVRPHTIYHAAFYARSTNGFSGPLTVSLESADGKTIFATAEVNGFTGNWQKFDATLKTKRVEPSKNNVFKITTRSPGIVWFQQVSLFPPTYKNRANGNRPDLMALLAAMHPAFLRLPGGNYLEGDTIDERFDWKKTIGPTEKRPGHESPWGYWSTDGLGLLEYMEWCEDLNIQPVLAVYAGYSLRHQHINPGDDLKPYVQDALDEIEYVSGDTSTRWGGQRAKDGHPAPFPLKYIEVGNEDWFDRSGSYDGRFAQFYDAIKAKFPQLQLIATAKVKSRVPDLIDEHYYRSEEEMEAHALDYDKYSRSSPTKIFCGEWATRVGSPTPNMAGALGDAAWMTGMERNSDIVLISSYAPLFVNVSDVGERGGSMQWRSDLIGYNALNSYGSPSYYAQVMFSMHHGDTILATDSENIPTQLWQPPAKHRNGVELPRPPAQQIRKIFFDATRDSQSGTIYLKLVNTLGAPQPVTVELSGIAKIARTGHAIVLKAASPDDTNSIDQPSKIVPIAMTMRGLGKQFTKVLPPYSITVLELAAK